MIAELDYEHRNPMTTENSRNEALLTIALFAAFADGDKHEREREEIRRIADSLSETGGPDLRALYQDVLLRRTTLENRRPSCTRAVKSTWPTKWRSGSAMPTAA